MADTLIRWPSPAKLNLFLHITGRRANGYHTLQTVFQILDSGDELEFKPRDDGQLTLASDIEPNLIIRAARALQQYAGTFYGADIVLHKNLPIGGGVGGGSSNAATTLLALNKLWNLNLPRTVLAEIGVSLGADVPVFILGHTAWADGIGEQLYPLTLPELWYVVIFPNCSVSTKEIFSHSELTRATPSLKIEDFRMNIGRNDCEPIVRKHYPAVSAALDWLNEFAKARLTGTGSCIFAAFESELTARQIAAQVPKTWVGWVAKGVNQSPVLKYV